MLNKKKKNNSESLAYIHHNIFELEINFNEKKKKYLQQDDSMKKEKVNHRTLRQIKNQYNTLALLLLSRVLTMKLGNRTIEKHVAMCGDNSARENAVTK